MCGRYALYGPFPAEDMLTYFVSKKVNRASYDAPELIEPIQDPNLGQEVHSS